MPFWLETLRESWCDGRLEVLKAWPEPGGPRALLIDVRLGLFAGGGGPYSDRLLYIRLFCRIPPMFLTLSKNFPWWPCFLGWPKKFCACTSLYARYSGIREFRVKPSFHSGGGLGPRDLVILLTRVPATALLGGSWLLGAESS